MERGGHNIVSFTSRSYQVTTVNIRQKPLQAFNRGRENKPFWNMPEHSVLNMAALRGNWLPRAELAGVLSKPNWCRDNPIPAQSSHPVTYMGVKNLRNTFDVHSLGSAGSPEGWDLIVGLTKVPFLPHLRTTSLKVCSQQCLLANTSGSAIKKKITRCTKRQKHTIWRERKHQNRPWQRCQNNQTGNLKQL